MKVPKWFLIPLKKTLPLQAINSTCNPGMLAHVPKVSDPLSLTISTRK